MLLATAWSLKTGKRHLVDPTDRFLSVRLRERIGGKARQ
jgi:hypothetical protein